VSVRLDIERVRKDFPILERSIRGRPLVFLDSAASAQKPRVVLEAMWDLYTHSYANIHRGVYELSERATAAFEASREKARSFLNAPEVREIVFVRSATEGINLVASSFGRSRVGQGDELLLTQMEHHSNIVPWQMLCEEKGATLRVAPIDDRGALCVDEFEKLLTPRTKLAALSHVSNALGTVNPVRELVEMAHRRGVPVLVDGAQAVPHQAVDVQELGCDFYVFSSHKLFGPSGVGVLWGRAEHLEAMPPYQGGGEMILSVSFEKTIYNEIPHKFEAGTPDIAGVVGLGAAIDYVTGLGLDAIGEHERDVLEYATQALSQLPGLRIIGTAPHKAAVISFVVEGVHPHDVGTVLDQEGVAVRTGHHCAQPVMEHFGLAATARASFALYNTRHDVDALVAGLGKVREVFA
jgi:cysteine desulfurase/selenocysteine lyase